MYDPSLIRIATKQIVISRLLEKIAPESLNTASDFPSHTKIWNNRAKSRLIESILVRIPIPVFYLDATRGDKWYVVDGLQRLSTFKQFMIDKAFKLSNLEFLPSLNSLTFDELDKGRKRRIEETKLIIHLIDQGTPPKISTILINEYLKADYYGKATTSLSINKND